MSPFLYFTCLITLYSSLFYSNEGIQVRQFITAQQPEKTSHLHFYFHDILSGKNHSAVRIIGPPNSTITSFGNTMMIDDALTEKQDPTSKIVGRAQGFYSVASRGGDEFAFFMVMNLVFVEGKCKGSSISVLGRNPVMNDVREMPIVGGRGLFRFARRYVLAHTVWFAPNTGDTIVKYNVFVSHNWKTLSW